MAISQNTRVIYTTKANLFYNSLGAKHGELLIGNNAFEFYNHRNPNDYIQIPWNEIKTVRAKVMFKGKYIHAFFIDTKQHGSFKFIASNAGKTLKVMREFIGNDKIVRHKPFFSLKKFFHFKQK